MYFHGYQILPLYGRNFCNMKVPVYHHHQIHIQLAYETMGFYPRYS